MTEKNNKDREIEARFLVCGHSWRDKGSPVEIYQGYLSSREDMVLRIRLKDDKAILTIKGKTVGLKKAEYEFALDNPRQARKVIDIFCDHPIEKTRHIIQHDDFVWEVDEYKGENQGLIIAEVEFEREDDYQKMLAKGKPSWVGKEITFNAWQYTNARLAVRPFSSWRAEEKQDVLQHSAGKASECLNEKYKPK